MPPQHCLSPWHLTTDFGCSVSWKQLFWAVIVGSNVSLSLKHKGSKWWKWENLKHGFFKSFPLMRKQGPAWEKMTWLQCLDLTSQNVHPVASNEDFHRNIVTNNDKEQVMLPPWLHLWFMKAKKQQMTTKPVGSWLCLSSIVYNSLQSWQLALN